jgi:hypothetical protein
MVALSVCRAASFQIHRVAGSLPLADIEIPITHHPSFLIPHSSFIIHHSSFIILPPPFLFDIWR